MAGCVQGVPHGVTLYRVPVAPTGFKPLAVGMGAGDTGRQALSLAVLWNANPQLKVTLPDGLTQTGK